jgi:hypothetical protein
MKGSMRLTATILVLAVFAGGIGAPSVCAALCATQAPAPQSTGHGHHGDHGSAGAPENTINANDCLQHDANAALVAMAPRATQGTGVLLAAIFPGTLTLAAAAAPAVPTYASPPSAATLPQPPLRN